MMIPQNSKHRITTQSSNSVPLLIKGLKAEIQTDTCTPMFIEALFTIAKSWKQFRYPSSDERINNIWHAHSEIHSLKQERNSDTYYNMSEL